MYGNTKDFEKEEQSGKNYALCNQNNIHSNQDSIVLEQKETQRLMKWPKSAKILHEAFEFLGGFTFLITPGPLERLREPTKS